MIPCSLFLARLKLFLLLVADQTPDFLLRFLMDLLNFLFLLLRRQRAVCADSLNLRTRVERDSITLFLRFFGDTCLLPTRLLANLGLRGTLCVGIINLCAARLG